jgi:23S rRNA pseudouridine1911/1915/1917 synthase
VATLTNAPVIKLSSPPTREYWEIPVLYEDEHLLALNKPSGLLSSPDRYDPTRPSLMKLLHAAIAEQKPWAQDRGITYLANAHRPDFETSGVMLLARTKEALVKLANLFGSEKPLKEYAALVEGNPGNEPLDIDAPLGPHPTRVGLTRVDRKHGKRSRTHVELEEAFSRWSLVRCRPLTDRTHQIRAHLRHVRCPVVGDALYGGKPLLLSRFKPGYRLKPGHEERPLINRVALHAAKLCLPHPMTAEPVEILAPLPKDLMVALKYLRKFAVPGALHEPLPGEAPP